MNKKTLTITCSKYTYIKHSNSGTLEELRLIKYNLNPDDLSYMISQFNNGKSIFGELSDYKEININII